MHKDTINYSVMLSDSISNEMESIIEDILETGLDSAISNEVINKIPIISLITSTYKIGHGIRERHYLKKLAAFIEQLNNGAASENQKSYYRGKLLSDSKKRDKEIERILIILDRFISEEKACMLAKLYLSYLDENISWLAFAKYAEVIDRFLPGDYEMLKSASTFKTEWDLETDAIQRLIALGLVIEGFRTMVAQENDGTVSIDPPELREKNERNYNRTEFGNVLVGIIEGN